MKKLISALLILTLLTACAPALAGGYYESSLLMSLEHNCPNTGVMLPASFSPSTTAYVLTVASWVSRVRFKPTAYNPSASITVNGQYVASGSQSQYINMTNNPQAVTIVVSSGASSTTYTVYLQRRPSERETRVSSGYITEIYQNDGAWYVAIDRVNVHYYGDDYGSGNLSSFNNDTSKIYRNAVTENCTLYYGTIYNPVRARNMQEFIANYLSYGSSLYRIVYIEDEVVALLPYAGD